MHSTHLFRALCLVPLVVAVSACGSSPSDLGGEEDSAAAGDSSVADVTHETSANDSGAADSARGDAPADSPADSTAKDSGVGDSSGIDSSIDSGIDSSIDSGTDSAPDTTPAIDTAPDATPIDTAPEAPPDAPLDCTGTPLAVDPPSSLDPLSDGPLGAGHAEIVVPALGPLTSVHVAIWYPTDSTGAPQPGKHAWVMFHHAVHDPMVIYKDYNKIFDRWATHGFIVFSIDGHEIYYPPPSGTWTPLTWTQQQTVGQVMDQAITYVLGHQGDPGFPVQCGLDANRTAVSGHSRGGGGALMVPIARTDGAHIKGYVGFQGVDPEALSGSDYSAIHGFDLPQLYLDAALDGDVSYPIVALEYSRARANATLVTILGSKHTFTLDDPLPDQGGATPTITPDEHKAVCNQYGIAFLRYWVRDASPSAADYDRFFGPGGMSTTASSGNITLRWREPNGDPAYLALLDWDTGATSGATVAGTPITVSGSMSAAGYETFSGSVSGGEATVSALIHSVRLSWTSTDGALSVPLPAGALVGKKAIVFDTADMDDATTSGTSPLSIELDDSTGAAAKYDVDSATGPGWKLRPKRLSVAYAPISAFTGVDATKATTIKLVPKTGATTGTSLVTQMRIE